MNVIRSKGKFSAVLTNCRVFFVTLHANTFKTRTYRVRKMGKNAAVRYVTVRTLSQMGGVGDGR